MKRAILGFLSLTAVMALHAQTIENADSAKNVPLVENKDSTKDAPLFTPSFAIKWNPESVVFGKISLFGEYNFKNRRSLTFNAGIPVETTTTWKIEDEDRKITMKSYSVMAGYRMYLGKSNMKGLYFEPYLKYMGTKGSFPYIDTKSVDSTPYFLSSKYRGGSIGAQLGVQFLIAKAVTLDFFFLGPEASLSKWDIDLQDQGKDSWTPQDAADALDVLNDIVDDLPPFISDNIKTSVNTPSKTVSAKFNGFLPTFRIGVSVGIRF